MEELIIYNLHYKFLEFLLRKPKRCLRDIATETDISYLYVSMLYKKFKKSKLLSVKREGRRLSISLTEKGSFVVNGLKPIVKILEGETNE